MQTLAQLKSGELKGTKKLKLSGGLTSFPDEILDLADSLEVLDLTGNQLSTLPPDFGQLKKLRIFFCSNNLFTEIPAVLGQCPQLDIIGFKSNKISCIPDKALPAQIRWLILTDNKIPELPASLGNCVNLQKVMLAGNKLSQLPPEMADCQKLELLRISANNFSQLPAWLLKLPRLSWLALAGNSWQPAPLENHSLPLVSWNNLIIQEQLGEGASGIIYKATWQQNENNREIQEVAVKLFKGTVTSDGLPTDEMAACLAAGSHPNIVQVLGKIIGHPDGKQGLVLRLIPPQFFNLGNPPSLITCTRDTYPVGTRFSLTQVGKIAFGIADAARHLHALGIMHGDLYAHNILIDDNAFPLMGDFGAATIYGKFDPEIAVILERIEVRAYGCLLEDLVNHLDHTENQPEIILFLNSLKQDCLQNDIGQRPDFATIVTCLQKAILI